MRFIFVPLRLALLICMFFYIREVGVPVVGGIAVSMMDQPKLVLYPVAALLAAALTASIAIPVWGLEALASKIYN